MNTREWSSKKIFNPFNSLKLLAHLERWRCIKRGLILPPPVLVTVDPTNQCNYDCIWCNSRRVITQKMRQLSVSALEKIVEALSEWKCANQRYGVNAVCIAGGGEPLLNKGVGFFIDSLVSKDIDVGVITNGRFMHEFIDSLAKCHWVSVSVDSGTAETFADLKNTDLSEFDRVIENMQSLIEYSDKNSAYLANSPLSFGVTYKFLVHEKNVCEIKCAAELAKSIGCRSVHIRPVGRPWYSKESILFDNEKLLIFHDEIRAARELEDENFSVYGVTHKFTSNFRARHNFLKCHALFMTTIFGPPGNEDHSNSFVLSQCCDRRGDVTVELSRNLKNLQDILREWGNDGHWEMQNKINLNKCPRCTYSPHNEIYESVLCEDNMSLSFI